MSDMLLIWRDINVMLRAYFHCMEGKAIKFISGNRRRSANKSFFCRFPLILREVHDDVN
jgi:hypothetical protein